MLPNGINNFIDQLKNKKFKSIVLMGSYARNDFQQYSDVDIVCFLDKKSEKKTLFTIIDQKYVVVSFVSHAEVTSWFTEPSKISECIMGVKAAKILWDPSNYFSKIQKEAEKFIWSDDIQKKANKYASNELVGWIEEVLKGIQGIKIKDTGRMINGIFGLTHGMLNVIRVQKGVLLSGENHAFTEVLESMRDNTKLVSLFQKSFGINENLSLEERVVEGLRCFDLVTEYLKDIIEEDDKGAINYAKAIITKELPYFNAHAQT